MAKEGHLVRIAIYRKNGRFFKYIGCGQQFSRYQAKRLIDEVYSKKYDETSYYFVLE